MKQIPKGGLPNAQKNRIEAQLEKQRLAVENAQKKAELAKQRQMKQKELQQKRLEATKKKEARTEGRQKPIITALGQPILSSTAKKTQEIKKNPTIKPPTIRPQISFFGAPKVPEVRRWRQNFDGSITGFIYDSKNFEDGTKVTTSPVPRGARKGTTVTTKGGTKYFLS
jgi:hypothetical protein